MPSVGQELLDVPFPDMVLKLALAIADAQAALDENSVETAEQLAETEVDLVLAMTQTIAADGTVTYTNAEPVTVSLMQIGLLPVFYQFVESQIEVTMDIKTTTSRETDIKFGSKAKVGFGLWSASARLDIKHNRKYGKEVKGHARLFTRLVPVPPPERIAPELIVVDNRPAEGEGGGE